MAARNFNLTPRLSSFINRQVEAGRHQNASEVVREALRRYETELEEEEARIAALRAVAAAGREAIERGEFTLVNGDDTDDLLRSLNEEAAALARSGADLSDRA
ncbi:type II toxin-antitoxin system ParD family antitoxin [Azospirillum sp. sgz301742]